VAAQIAGSIWNCKDILSLDPQASKSSNEATAIAHRFKTTLTSLLQDRTIEGRWAAVVLTKAAVEAGGVATLSKSNGWVKSLVAILKKPGPPTTRQLAVITLTRIFMLTWDHSNLVREITTPALPAFISTCLSNVEKERCSAGELEAVLEAFRTLIARHPTVFRTHEAQIPAMVLRILSASSDSSDGGMHFSQSHQSSAARLLIVLHHCAPKQGAAEAWEKAWSSTIVAAHDTCAQLFRSIIEDSHLERHTPLPAPMAKNVSGEIGVNSDDAVGLRGWRGVNAGSERLMTLINLLKSRLETATGDRVNLRLGSLIELVARILNLTLDIEGDSSRHNHQTPKDEREALFCIMPDVHVATLDLITSLLQIFEMASAPFIQFLQELTLGVFRAEHSSTSIRAASYTTLNQILRTIGPSMSKADVSELSRVITVSCQDLLPDTTHTMITQHSGTIQMDGANSTDSKSARHPPKFPHLVNAANAFLATLAAKVNPFAMPTKLRVQIERTSILARNKDALVALVLNPAAKGSRRTLESSLLPILARECPDAPEVEALLRPRMPPVVGRQGGVSDDAVVNDAEAEEQQDLMEDTLHVNGGDGMDLFEVERPTAVERNGLHTRDSTGLTGQEDDLYSLTPPRNLSNESEEQIAIGASPSAVVNRLNGMKRSAEVEVAETSPPVKRTRMSSTDNSAIGMADAGGDVLSHEQAPGHAVSGRLDVGQPEAQNVSQSRPIDLPMDHTATVPSIRPTAAARDDIGSDESDFEMPPLTMEPDTDPEEDEEDDEE
jgi:hypothetical protein